MLELQGVSKSYRNHRAVDQLSLHVKRGEIFGLVGSNGSGKTTTFRMILRLLAPDEGTIRFDHKDISLADPTKFGYLPEERSLYRDMTLLDQCYFLGQLKGMSKEAVETQLKRWMEILEINQYRNHRIKMLSKGNQQKVQFLSCLLHDPEILIFDEPFSGLDPYNLELLKKIFLSLKQEGKIILLSTHRLDHIESFCTRMLLLEKGKTIMSGEIQELRRQSAIRYVRVTGGIQYHQLKMMEEIDAIEKEGKGYRLMFQEESKAKLIAAKLMKRKDCLHVSYELPTLLDLYMASRGMMHE